MKQPTLAFLVSIAVAMTGPHAIAAFSKAPAPSAAIATDLKMATVNKRKVGSFTLSWTPAHDATGRERKIYDILTANCEVRSAGGAPLALAVGGRLHTMSGPPYSVLLSNCTCLAAVSVYTAPVAPESGRSDPVEARRGAIFGPPC
jgi:hypothetical protein